jgi:predicted dienelactone hydrolase
MTAQQERIEYAPPTGPHAVGVRDGAVLDTTYRVIRPEDEASRRLMVRVWYPAASTEGQRRLYFEGAELEVMGLSWVEVMQGTIPAGWMHRLAEVQTYSILGAEIAPGRWPTLIFSHGGGTYVSQNTPLMEHLASHGYVVWSVAHPGEAAGIVYPDGTTTRIDEQFLATLAGLVGEPSYIEAVTGEIAERLTARRTFLDRNPLEPWALRWVDDMIAVADAVENGTVTDDATAMTRSCDLSVLGLFGMSFGGAAATSAAQKDARVKAVVNLDGGQFLADLLETDVRVPLLAINSDMSPQLEAMGMTARCLMYNEFFFEPLLTLGVRIDIQRLLVPGASHAEFTDLALIPAEERTTAFPGAGTLASQRLVDLMNTCIGAYFDRVLLGAENGYPARQLAQFPEILTIDVSPLRDWAAQQRVPESAS